MNVKLWGSALALAACSVVASAGQIPEYVPGEVLVKFKNSSASVAARAANRHLGAEVVRELGAIGVSLVRIPDNITVERAVRYYSSLPGVAFAEPNGIVRATFTPDDTFYASNQWGPQKINCPAAWDITMGDPSVVIAIVDTGCNLTHPDLVGKFVAGYDFVNSDNDPTDDNGHGTHCAGIAAANTNNATGIAGVGFNCSVMPVKVLGAGGSGSYEQVAAGVDFATTNGAKVISMSLGGYGTSATLQTAIDNAWSNGILVVAAAGNDNTTTNFYPAFYSNCIAVASTTTTDARSSFSNYGSWVDVAAPGSGIYSCFGAGYTDLNGTSMACPHVAGLGGLLWSSLGSGTPVSTIRQRIENNCDNVGSFVSHGRVNALKALLGGAPAPAPGVDSIIATPRVIRSGQRSRITVTLSRAAPTGGTRLVITTSSRAASMPSTITVPARGRSITFNATGLPTTVERRVDITVASGRSSQTAGIIVRP